MAVFQYTAVDKRREDYRESGTVLAQSEEQARQKLKRLNLEVVRVKRMGGLAGILKWFSADVK